MHGRWFVVLLLCPMGSLSLAACPDGPGIQRHAVGNGTRWAATGRATALSVEPGDLRVAHAEARLAALALLAGRDGLDTKGAALVGALPTTSCEEGTDVTETVVVDPGQVKAAEDLSKALGAPR